MHGPLAHAGKLHPSLMQCNANMFALHVGDGSYFAQDIEKADQYTKEGDGTHGEAGLDLLCAPIY
jgi:hypothetical protein